MIDHNPFSSSPRSYEELINEIESLRQELSQSLTKRRKPTKSTKRWSRSGPKQEKNSTGSSVNTRTAKIAQTPAPTTLREELENYYTIRNYSGPFVNFTIAFCTKIPPSAIRPG